MKLWMIQYPHGFNDGFEYHDGKAPPHYIVVAVQQLFGNGR